MREEQRVIRDLPEGVGGFPAVPGFIRTSFDGLSKHRKPGMILALERRFKCGSGFLVHCGSLTYGFKKCTIASFISDLQG